MPSTQGGMSRHCEELYARLADRGHSVTVFCHRTEGSTLRGMQLKRIPGVRIPAWERLGYSFVASVRALFGRFDIVHYHSYASSGFCFVPRLARKKIVVTVHRLEWQDKKWGRVARGFLKLCERIAVRSAAALIAVSQALTDDLVQRYHRTKGVHHISNGITEPVAVGAETLTAMSARPGTYALVVGRVVPEKGIEVAIDAFATFTNDSALSEHELLIVGAPRHSQEYLDELERRVAQTGAKVRFLGVRTGTDLQALYEHAAVVIAPAHHEGQGLTVLEAMSHGRCVIASDLGPHAESIGDAGILFPPGDAPALARALREVLTDPAKATALGARAKKRVLDAPEYSWDHVATATEQILVAL